MTSEAENRVEWKYEPQSLAGKSALVTGGTTGIGRAIAVMLAGDGARVLIFGRHEKELQDALDDLNTIGSQAYGIIADQSREEDIIRVFQEVDKSLGSLDILINNAAVAGESSLDSKYSDIEYMVQTNVTAHIACAREAVNRMKPRGAGHIVNIGSMSAITRKPDSDVYSATKAAVQAYSESLRKGASEMGIRVTLIEPGKVGADLGDESDEEQRKGIEDHTMLAAEDIAECVRYCLVQPERCNIVAVQIRPIKQAI